MVPLLRGQVKPDARPRNSPSVRAVVAGLVVASTLLALGAWVLLRGVGSGGDLATTAGSAGPAGSTRPAAAGSQRTHTEAYVGSPEGGRATDGNPGGAASPSVTLDPDAEYKVEDGLIEPVRTTPSRTVPVGDGGEPSVPQGLPSAVRGPVIDDPSEPEGARGSVAGMHEQLVPGEHGNARESDVTAPAATAEEPTRQEPRI